MDAACSRQRRASGVVAGTARGSHSRAFATRRLWPTTSPQGRMAVEGLTDSASSLVSPNTRARRRRMADRKSTRLNSSHLVISYAVFCLKKNNPLLHLKLSRTRFAERKRQREDPTPRPATNPTTHPVLRTVHPICTTQSSEAHTRRRC